MTVQIILIKYKVFKYNLPFVF